MASGSSNDKDLTIGVKAETAAAEASLKKVGEEARDAGKAAAEGSKEATAAIEKQTAAITAQVGELGELTDAEAGVIRTSTERLEQAKKLNAETEKAASETKKLNDEGSELKTLLLGQGIAQGAEVFGKMAAGLHDAAGSLKEVNPELAETVEKSAKLADGLSSILSGVSGGALLGSALPGLGTAAGATIGGIIALLGELSSAWVKMAAEAATPAKDLTDELEKVRQKAADILLLKESNANHAFAKVLDEEADSYRRLNEAMAENIRLTNAKLAAQNEIEAGKDAADLAEVDADPNLSEAEKIKRRAEIRERGFDRQTTGRLVTVGEKIQQSQAEFETRREAAIKATDVSATAAQDAQNAKDERDKLKPKVAAIREIPSANVELEAAERELGRANLLADDESTNSINGPQRQKDVAAAQKRFDAAQKRLEELKGAAGTEADVRRLKALEGEKGQPGIIEERDKIAAERAEAQNAATQAAMDAAKKRDEAVRLGGIETEGIIGAADQNRRARGITTATQVRQAEERKKKEDERKQEQADRKKEQEDAKAEREHDSEGSQLTSIARTGEGIARGKHLERGARAFEQIKTKLGDGADKGEAAELAKLLEGLLAYLEKSDPTGAQASQVRELQNRVNKLEGSQTKDIPHRR